MGWARARFSRRPRPAAEMIIQTARRGAVESAPGQLTAARRRFRPFAAAAGKGSNRPGCDIHLERTPAAGVHTVSRFVDWRTCQYHRNLHLSIRDFPVSLEKRRLVRWRDQLEAVARVEANCPIRSFPGANQDAPRAQLPQMPKESPTNAAPLAARQDVSDE